MGTAISHVLLHIHGNCLLLVPHNLLQKGSGRAKFCPKKGQNTGFHDFQHHQSPHLATFTIHLKEHHLNLTTIKKQKVPSSSSAQLNIIIYIKEFHYAGYNWLSFNRASLAHTSYFHFEIIVKRRMLQWMKHRQKIRYPAINKPAGIVRLLNHSKDAQNVDWVVILDADMIIQGPIMPWELSAEKGRPVAAYYGYLIGRDNILAHLHTKHLELCDNVGGLLAMHIYNLRALAPLWLSKTEEVRDDRVHWTTSITVDIYAKGWINEMYGYSFGAAEVD